MWELEYLLRACYSHVKATSTQYVRRAFLEIGVWLEEILMLNVFRLQQKCYKEKASLPKLA